jgi:uroporphyrinogen-III synthase
MQANPVVITRPLAQAKLLAARVADLGREVELLPLLEIHPLPDATPLAAALSDLQRYAMVAFVSPNAIDAAMTHVSQWPAGVKLAIVGEGSRLALAAHGITADNATIFSPQDLAHSDSEHLLKALDLASLRGQRVLIVRGDSGRELLADSLRAADIMVTTLSAYRRTVPSLTPALGATLRRLLAKEHDWIVTSSEALRGLLRLLAQLDAESGTTEGAAKGAADGATVVKLQQQHLIVPHARIAQTATELGCTRLTLTGSGDELVLAALQSSP